MIYLHIFLILFLFSISLKVFSNADEANLKTLFTSPKLRNELNLTRNISSLKNTKKNHSHPTNINFQGFIIRNNKQSIFFINDKVHFGKENLTNTLFNIDHTLSIKNLEHNIHLKAGQQWTGVLSNR